MRRVLAPAQILALVALVGCTSRPPVQDSDGDGVPNSADRCPDVPGFRRIRGARSTRVQTQASCRRRT